MAEPFKNILNEKYFKEFSGAVKCVIPDFDERLFISQIFDDEWKNREIKQRMRHVSTVLKNFLPKDFKKAAAKILELVRILKQKLVQKEGQFGLSFELFLPDYIEQFGIDDLETSVKAFEEITQYVSCELAVRSFIIKYPKEMMKQMLSWSKHKDQWVRRLSSEGCRPRLPWAMALPELKKNPAPIIPILENLKNDTSEWVRLSVANNLNDIAKDNPQTVIDLVKKWRHAAQASSKGLSANTEKIIKHGCRTLLKEANAEVLELFGFGSAAKNILVQDFKILTPKVKIGSSLEFEFKLLNKNKQAASIRLEYGLYYQKANGTLSKKVCRISEKEYAASSVTPINRKHSFKVVTTRVLHPGLHQVLVIVNGKEFDKHDFMLVK